MNKWLEDITEKISSAQYRINQNFETANSDEILLAASKSVFSWKGFVILSQHILIKEITNPTREDFKTLFNDGFSYGKKQNKIPLLRGMQFGYVIIHCIVSDNITEELITYVEQQPQSHFSLFEFPVLIDKKTKQLHYFKKTPAWGAFFFSDMRQVVKDFLDTNESS